MEKNEIAIHLDVGHESIGWSVSRFCPGSEEFLRFLGTGVVLFPADDCLANHRRAFRRQRRHIRATRQRIARMKALFLSRGVLTSAQLESNQFAAPWKLAASVLSGGHTLNWQELWYVLIPSSVVTFGDNIFDKDNGHLTLFVEEGSPAAQYASVNGLKYQYTSN